MRLVLAMWRKTRIRLWLGRLRLGLLWLEGRLASLFGLRRAYKMHLARLVREVSLFDADYYRESNSDIAGKSLDPLIHYVAYGDREGRQPMPFFDPGYYRSHAKGRLKSVNSLLHYAWVGRYLRISPSPWFDVAYYLAQNKDVARASLDPLVHYVSYGGVEGRSPCANFDGAFYLRSNPDVAQARVNPLLHYLRFGRIEGRATLPAFAMDAESDNDAPIPIASLPTEHEWGALRAGHSPTTAVVDVVVPVYKGRAETLRCLFSVLSAINKTPYELVVINDASPDPDLTADLVRLAGRGLFSLSANAGNRGFVYTVNRGMAMHDERDVALLNSDTEVYGDWLDRLRQASRRHQRTGTVTPLSNNATICSYPRFLHDNPYPLEIGYEALDALAAEANAGVEAEAPTAVGFCMYIRRDCLKETGLFDEDAFGKGYGEENDFCQRAIRKGWRNIIVADVFVRHWGSTSFQGERANRVQSALRVLDKRYPDYQKDVRQFIEQDALAAARRELDWVRLKAQAAAENVLIVCHSRGGGAERHVQEDTRELLAAGVGVFYMRPQRGHPSHVQIAHPFCKTLPNLEPFSLADIEALGTALGELGITRIHTHGLVDFAPDAPERIKALAQLLGVPLWVDVHDYKVICPRINLIDREGRYCGEPADEAHCDACLVREGNDFGVRSIRDWRAMHHQVLRAAERILVPDQDVADRLARYYPDFEFTVSPHEEIDSVGVEIQRPTLAAGERLRIVIIGAIGKMKGYDILLACARDAKKRRLPLDFILLGYSMDDSRLEQAGVTVTGRYLEQEALDKLHALAPHVVWLPSTWPETYSYTLSLALQGGYPVFSFDLGAIARRLRSLGQVKGLLPTGNSSQPEKINQSFMEIREQSLSVPIHVPLSVNPS